MFFLGLSWPVYILESSPGLGPAMVAYNLVGVVVMLALAAYFAWLRTQGKPEAPQKTDISFLIYALSVLLTFLLITLVNEGLYQAYLESLVTIVTGVLVAIAIEGRSQNGSPAA